MDAFLKTGKVGAGGSSSGGQGQSGSKSSKNVESSVTLCALGGEIKTKDSHLYGGISGSGNQECPVLKRNILIILLCSGCGCSVKVRSGSSQFVVLWPPGTGKTSIIQVKNFAQQTASGKRSDSSPCPPSFANSTRTTDSRSMFTTLCVRASLLTN